MSRVCDPSHDAVGNYNPGGTATSNQHHDLVTSSDYIAFSVKAPLDPSHTSFFPEHKQWAASQRDLFVQVLLVITGRSRCVCLCVCVKAPEDIQLYSGATVRGWVSFSRRSYTICSSTQGKDVNNRSCMEDVYIIHCSVSVWL